MRVLNYDEQAGVSNPPTVAAKHSGVISLIKMHHSNLKAELPALDPYWQSLLFLLPLPSTLPTIFHHRDFPYYNFQCISITDATYLLGCPESESLQVGNHLNEESQEITVIPTLTPAQNKFHVD